MYCLPQELFPYVTGHLSQREKSSLARTCRHLYFSVNPLLYDHDRVHGDNHALWWACSKNEMSTLVKVLLRNTDVVNHHFREMHSLPKRHRVILGENVTPLVVALQAGHNKIAAGLVKNGADVNIPDKNPVLSHTRCWYPINWVVDTVKVGQQPEKAIEYLRSHGANINQVPKDSENKYYDLSGNPRPPNRHHGDSFPIFRALSLAPPPKSQAMSTATAYNKDFCKLLDLRLAQMIALLKAGADPNIRDPDTGYTPLFHTLAAVEKYKPTFNFDMICASTYEKETQLYEVIMPYVLKFLQELVRWGADVNVFGTKKISPARQEELTPLHLVCGLDERFEPLTLFLLESGAHINAVADNGRTPLFYYNFSSMRDARSLNRFIEKGAKLNHQDDLGQTILHFVYASELVGPAHLLELVNRVLLSYGADLNIEDRGGRTAVELARQEGRTEYANIRRAIFNPIREHKALKKMNARPQGQGKGRRYDKPTHRYQKHQEPEESGWG
ncbi:ankyrin repeat-containing domain protein [Xylariaceae sp. FL0662B]|nr:ankyrin repeat-containing domain protein [Xylariaceae sp. FL0662B]